MRSLSRFALVGVGGLGLYVALFLSLNGFMSAQAASSIARLVVAVPTVSLQAHWAFGVRPTVGRVSAGVAVTFLSGFVATTACLHAVAAVVADPSTRTVDLAVALAVAPAALLRFAVLRSLVFATLLPSSVDGLPVGLRRPRRVGSVPLTAHPRKRDLPLTGKENP